MDRDSPLQNGQVSVAVQSGHQGPLMSEGTQGEEPVRPYRLGTTPVLYGVSTLYARRPSAVGVDFDTCHTWCPGLQPPYAASVDRVVGHKQDGTPHSGLLHTGDKLRAH